MDQVFQRIDQCDSAAGEAVLYNMLHCTDNGQAQWKELLKYYEEQAEPRKKAEAILISLGKREGLYYLPEYVDTLQAVSYTHLIGSVLISWSGSLQSFRCRMSCSTDIMRNWSKNTESPERSCMI